VTYGLRVSDVLKACAIGIATGWVLDQRGRGPPEGILVQWAVMMAYLWAISRDNKRQ
jgi:hypothetical protein